MACLGVSSSCLCFCNTNFTGYNYTIRVMCAVRHTTVAILCGHTSDVRALAVAHDGNPYLMRACVHMCVYMYICVHIHTHTHTLCL
jgi:hypothetical protein